MPIKFVGTVCFNSVTSFLFAVTRLKLFPLQYTATSNN